MNFKRHELKYYLNDLETASLSASLGAVLAPDENANQHNEYCVRSLYFDSFDDECLYQKQSGILKRKKIRLRTYGDSGNGIVRFEIKHKQGQMVFKETATLEKTMASRICAGDYALLLEQNNPVLDRVYAVFTTKLYTPRVIVEYMRMAFVMPALNIRITFDRNLRSNINHLDLFSGLSGVMPVILEGKQILEVKYDSYMPNYLRRVLSSVSAERMAISKYTLARRFHKQFKWEDN